MADFTLKQGDLEPSVTEVLGIDLTGFVDVLFRMAPVLTRVETFSRTATITDALTGTVSYAWQAGDTDIPGVYYAEFVAETTGPRPQSFPNTGYLVIAIEPKL